VTRVALLGFGTVGSAVARRLVAPVPGKPVLTHIFDRRAAEKRADFSPNGAPVVWTDAVETILHSDVDVIVEAIGGLDPAGAWIRRALEAGKSVVTANKQVVAREGHALWSLAARQGRQFRFEAAVGGAMPIVRAIGEGLAGDRLTRIDAILNGTTNGVLSQMDATGCSLSEALAAAQARGWAEANPSQDLDGDDARAKLAILCALAFGLRVDPLQIAATSSAAIVAADFAEARRSNGTIRQIAHAEYDAARRELTAWVAPIVVDRGSLFARAVGPQNAAVITGEHSGEIGIFGAGAGGDATAVAIVSDVVAIARDRAAIVPPPAVTSDFTLRPSPFKLRTSHFVLPEAV
jgi:homoserine dehydrogenase